MIRPLIVDEGRKRAIIAVSVFGIGAVASSAVVGLILGFLGSALVPGSEPATFLIVAAAGILFAIGDLFGRTPTTLRQTKKKHWRRGPLKASFLWGLDLGVGFTSVRVASLYWMVALALFVLGSVPVGAMMGAYGGGLALSLAAATVGRGDDHMRSYHPLHALQFLSTARTLVAAFTVSWSLFLFAAAFV